MPTIDEIKICTKCGIEKPLDKFRKYKRGDRYQYRGECRTCEKIKKKSTYQKYREKNLKYAKKYRKSNPGKTRKAQRKWEKENKEYRSEYNKRIKKSNVKRNTENKKKWIIENKEKHNAWKKEYYPKYIKERRQNDLNFKIAINLRSRIKGAIQKKKNKIVFIELLGCSIKQCRCYIELQFTDGMSWDNYGLHGWHVDHIKPLRAFDLTDPEQQKQCFHYSNLQPLWWYENLSKGAKIANN